MEESTVSIWRKVGSYRSLPDDEIAIADDLTLKIDPSIEIEQFMRDYNHDDWEDQCVSISWDEFNKIIDKIMDNPEAMEKLGWMAGPVRDGT